jgi:D-lyxose ketol-isomerase
MLDSKEVANKRMQAAEMYRQAGIYITEQELAAIEIAEFGLDKFEETGLAVLVYVNTDRCCAKELAMWPGQTCPEHRHPPVGSDPGKEETFRCRWGTGTAYLYVEGEPTEQQTCEPPGDGNSYTVFHEIPLKKGDQYTILPNTLHWFQAGDLGAVVSEFSTRSTDENDVFTDAQIRRLPTA